MKVAVVYTMKGCPFCSMIKEELEKENISFLERDIHEYEEEYDEFSKVTENEFVPAFMLIENPETEPISELYAPDRDYQDIEDGVKIIKE